MASVKHGADIVIVEPQRLLCSGVAQLIRTHYPALTVEAASTWDYTLVEKGQNVLRMAIVTPILTLHDPKLLHRIRYNNPSVTIVALQSTHIPRETIQQFDDCIDVFMSPEEVLGRLSPYISTWEKTTAQRPQLSVREIEVLRLLVLGKTAKEIGKELYISEHTVTTHRKNIAEKLGIKTIPGMTIYAVSSHLIALSDLQLMQKEGLSEE